MYNQPNPFLQHGVRHAQSLLNESNRAVTLSQEIMATCDSIIMNINSGNSQGAINAAQNVKNMAVQVAQSTQTFNQAINERMDMATYFLSRIQSKVNEMSNAIQSIRGTSNIGASSGINQYGGTMPYTCMSYQQPTTPII